MAAAITMMDGPKHILMRSSVENSLLASRPHFLQWSGPNAATNRAPAKPPALRVPLLEAL